MAPRRGLIVGLTAVAALASVAGCTGKRADPDESASSSGTVGPSGSSVAGGEALRVVESGLSTRSTSQPRAVTFGIVVENTSTSKVALRTSLEIRFVDASGKTAIDVGTLGATAAGIDRIFPGERVGVGQVLPVYDERARLDEVVKIEVAVKVSTWVDPGSTERVSISDARKQRDAEGTLIVDYTVTSTFRQPLTQPKLALVYRDRTGKIIGGLSPFQADRKQRTWPPGRSVQHEEIGSRPPAGIDDAKTDVYVQP